MRHPHGEPAPLRVMFPALGVGSALMAPSTSHDAIVMSNARLCHVRLSELEGARRRG